MQKPVGYEEAPIMGEYVPLEVGGHYLVIREVVETQSKAGKAMLRVCFDTDKVDKQPGYFAQEYKARVASSVEASWPNGGTAYIITDDQYGTSRLKGFITSIEKSNPGFQVAWGDGPAFAKQFEGRRVGGVFGEELDWYSVKSKETHKVKLVRWTETGKVGTAVAPEPSESAAHKAARENGLIGRAKPTIDDLAAKANGEWLDVPNNLMEELPFN